MKKPAPTTPQETIQSLHASLKQSYFRLVDVLEDIQERFQLYFRSRSVPTHIYDAEVQRFEDELDGILEVARRDLECLEEPENLVGNDN